MQTVYLQSEAPGITAPNVCLRATCHSVVEQGCECKTLYICSRLVLEMGGVQAEACTVLQSWTLSLRLLLARKL